ncbi:SAM-dependent methyltransferase [Clostridium perfringens]|uniref:HsdM family class I SAM-dependent methyltransferase n=1 Tax=Clostridium perfringens TaxID=1502 RepID=UPI00214727C0|nr:SAM-dependent methyltransferase [Clostridium perfringens]UUR83919.1 SAM-dependent methyltransferase [Clostridium perfringens]
MADIYKIKTNEADLTDRLVQHLLDKSGIEEYHIQYAGYDIVLDALKGASKSGNGHGIPDFNFLQEDFLVLIEDKLDLDKLESTYKDGVGNTHLSFNEKDVQNYAVNGAVYYAQKVLENENLFEKIIAIGVVGGHRRYKIQPYYVDRKGYKKLGELVSFDVFTKDKINEYYRVNVLGEISDAQKELREINDIASQLHEDLRTFGKLGSDNKATVVSAILLALKAGLLPESLTGKDSEDDSSEWDGKIIYRKVESYINRLNIQPVSKKEILLNQFKEIETNKILNTRRKDLANKTPLRKFAETLNNDVLHHIVNGSEYDILGQFYSEFVRYGGSDGSDLGIVLTPQHVTSLMAELIDVNPDDNVLDPAMGTASFPISSMNRMISLVNSTKLLSESEKKRKINEIRLNRIYGIEVDSKLFSIALTNMILRGGENSNLHRDDIFHCSLLKNKDTSKETTKDNKEKDLFITKILMNPPYSQAKKSTSKNESEMHFILQALTFLKHGGKAAFIVPQSSMTQGPKGVSKKEYIQLKQDLLDNNTINAVITMNSQTFYPKATDTVIVIITKGIPQQDKRTIFYDYRNDGYTLNHHIGLQPDGTELDKRKRLIDVINDKIDVDSSIAVKHSITAEDEWLHSYFYFNDSIPEEKDFYNSMAEYLSFEFRMKTNGRGYLFESLDERDDNSND